MSIDVAALRARAAARSRACDAYRVRVGKPPLFPFQREGIDELAGEQLHLLSDDPGLGKSAQAALAADDYAPLVVVCLAGAAYKWRDELATWTPWRRARLRTPGTTWRWPEPGEALITSWESLPPAVREIRRLQSRIVSAIARPGAPGPAAATLQARLEERQALRHGLTAPWRGTVLVLDEAHRTSNDETQFWLRAAELARRVVERDGFAWGLTAHPHVNSLDNFWNVLDAIGLGTRTWSTREEFLEEAKSRPEAFAQRVRRIMLRRLREDVLPQLPKKTREVYPVPLDDRARAQLQLVGEWLARAGLDVANADWATIQRWGAPNGPAPLAAVRKALAALKVPAMLEFVGRCEAQQTALVVASCHRNPIEVLRRRPGCVALLGGESRRERYRAAAAFQAGDVPVLGMTEQAGGQSIDLFRAWRMLLVDLPWNPMRVTQTEDRILRIGSDDRGRVYTRMTADHELDRRPEQVIREKQEAEDRYVNSAARRSAPPEAIPDRVGNKQGTNDSGAAPIN